MAERFKDIPAFPGWPSWLTRNLLKDRLPSLPATGTDTSEESPYQEHLLGNLPYRPVVSLPKTVAQKSVDFPDRKPFAPVAEMPSRSKPTALGPKNTGPLTADRMVQARTGGLDPIVQTAKEALEETPVTQEAQAQAQAPEEFDWEAEMRRREPWAGLQALGFGLMASKNPRLLGALGEAGLKAMSTVEGVADSARREAATKLSKKAQLEAERHARETEARLNKQLDIDERLRTDQLNLGRDSLSATIAAQKAQNDYNYWKTQLENDPNNPKVRALVVSAGAQAQNAASNAQEVLNKNPVVLGETLFKLKDANPELYQFVVGNLLKGSGAKDPNKLNRNQAYKAVSDAGHDPFSPEGQILVDKAMGNTVLVQGPNGTLVPKK